MLAVVLAGGSLAAYVKYRSVWDGINRIDVGADLNPTERPPADPNAENILLIGSDTRTGVNGLIGGKADIAGARSDTVMLVHVAPQARQVVVLSFPRDSVVPILSCAAEDGTLGQNAAPAYDVEQINSTFAYGGPGCLWKTIEQTTGIHIDHFIELTFIGFENAINNLGGVNVCLPEAVDDPTSKLDLSAGEHHIYGSTALAFWRTREGLGLGSDPQRIQRDQFLMAGLFQGIEYSKLLRSPTKMLSVATTLTKSHDLTTDSGLTVPALVGLGEDLRGITGDAVQFVTVPSTTFTGNAQWIDSAQTPSGGNSNWIQWQQPQANEVFSAISHDTKVSTSASTAAPAKSSAAKTSTGKSSTGTSAQTATAAAATPSPTASVSPANVSVRVFNGAGIPGLASKTATALSGRGFDVVGSPGDAASDAYKNSVIEYASSDELPAAQALAQAIGDNVDLRLDPSLAGPALDLIVGSTFTSLAPPPDAVSNLASSYNGITGNTNICSDAAAFQS